MRQHYENVMELHVRHVKRLLTDFKGGRNFKKMQSTVPQHRQANSL